MGKAVDPALRQLLKRGGDFDPLTGLDLMAAAAKEHGLAWCVADCDKARSRSAVFRAVVKAVDYPQFFGGDFDGLFDCLREALTDLKNIFSELESNLSALGHFDGSARRL